MTISEFVKDLWESCSDDSYTKHMDLDTARTDLDNFRRSEFTMPEDITPEAYMEAWNELVDENTPKLWYAIMKDSDDFDWGTGTYDKDEAIRRVKALLIEYPDATSPLFRKAQTRFALTRLLNFEEVRYA